MTKNAVSFCKVHMSGHEKRRFRGGVRHGRKKEETIEREPLESNAWRWQEADSNGQEILERNATIECCFGHTSSFNFPNTSPFTDEQSLKIAQILSKLSLDEQMNDDFLVPTPPIGEEFSKTTVAPKVESKKEDLDEWLDSLL